MLALGFVAAAFLIVFLLAYHRCAAPAWIVSLAAPLAVTSWIAGARPWNVAAWILLVIGAALLGPGSVRRRFVSTQLLRRFRRVLPRISDTEREALDAGTVWWDGELLAGNPDWGRFAALPRPQLAPEEQAFLDGPVHELCEMLDEWRITRELHDLPPEAWDRIRRHGFLGMIIPKAYGGLGFSALAHSEVIMKLASRSSTAAVSVMVPNSLGPAELLLHYGTQEQKDHYLPRLAQGLEIPCFALTGPEAGSDASSIPDFGVVCRGNWDGCEVLGMRLTWEKRYITLGPIATVIGLAVRLYDPERLIGPREDCGITLALVPASTPGVHIGRRHNPMDAAFMNGPTWGCDVFLPLSFVIGGAERAGHGWAMLMNCLAAGRSLSLPANSCGVAKLCALTAGAYARVRRQFGLPLGRFEGIEAVLARIAGNTYVMEAVRRVTAAALDRGEKPAVISAIVKYHLTERVREVVNDAMDLHGGKGICMGPGNYLAQAYQQIPIAITVEGANILTRSLIIYGQGAIRGHPYLLREIAAADEEDHGRALRDFDAAVFGHGAYFLSNTVRAWWLGLTATANVSGLTGRYRQLTRFSAALAFATDVVLAALGGSLKRRERISARLGDVLSLLYLGSCVVKRYEDEGRQPEDRPLLDWALTDILHRIESAFAAVSDNLRPSWAGRLIRCIVLPRGAGMFSAPSDALEHAVAAAVLEPGPARERLTAGIFVSSRAEDAVATLEAALRAVLVSEPAEARLRGVLPVAEGAGADDSRVLARALAAGIISDAECKSIEAARGSRRAAIMVDDFPRDLGRSETYRTTQAVDRAQLERDDRD